jgi:hypothetical protein
MEEVERQCCRDGGYRVGGASTTDGGEHDHEDENQRDVGVEQVVAERGQRGISRDLNAVTADLNAA